MTFVPVSSNGNLYHSANHNSKKYKSLSQLHISQWSFILSFKKKSGFDPDRGMLFANFLSLAPADQKFSAYPLQNSASMTLLRDLKMILFQHETITQYKREHHPSPLTFAPESPFLNIYGSPDRYKYRSLHRVLWSYILRACSSYIKWLILLYNVTKSGGRETRSKLTSPWKKLKGYVLHRTLSFYKAKKFQK